MASFSSSEHFELMRDTANYFFSNEMYEDASQLYEKASVYFNSPEAKLSAAIAYIKISERIKKKSIFYLKKALKHLNSLVGRWNNPLVNYYRGVVLSLLGEYEEATKDFDNLYDNIEEIKDLDMVIHVDFNFIIPSMDNYVYEYLYEAPLVKLYRLLANYEIGSKRTDFLKAFFSEEDEEMAKAREIKRIYSKVSSSKELKKYLWTDVAVQQASALIYMWGDERRAIDAIKQHTKYYFIMTEKLPPLTASILDQIVGINFRIKGLPFFVEIEIDNITKISKIFKKMSHSKNLNEIVFEIVDFVSENGLDVKPISSDRIYRTDLFNYLRRVLSSCIDRLYRRAISYYSSRETSNLLRVVIEPLPISKNEKEEILLAYSS